MTSRAPLRHLLPAAAVIALLAASAAAPAAPCSSPRPFTPEETAFLAGQTRDLTAALPAPPAGWSRAGNRASSSGAPLCDDPGYHPPVFVRIDALDLPSGAPELDLPARQAASDEYAGKVAAATREVREASAAAGSTTDPQRLQRARRALRELTARPVPTPSPNERSARRLDVRLQVNASAFSTCAAAAIDVPGAAFAFRAAGTTCRSKLAGAVLTIAWGTWKARPGGPPGAFLAGFNQWPGPAADRAAVHTVLLDISGDPDAVDAVARLLDTAKLQSLLPKS